MEFEWDEEKRRQGIAKHQVDLLLAAGIFEGPVFVADDDRADYGETRKIAVGMVGAELFVVVFTERDGRIRLISARKGGRRDRRNYQTRLAGGPDPDAGSR